MVLITETDRPNPLKISGLIVANASAMLTVINILSDQRPASLPTAQLFFDGTHSMFYGSFPKLKHVLYARLFNAEMANHPIGLPENFQEIVGELVVPLSDPLASLVKSKVHADVELANRLVLISLKFPIEDNIRYYQRLNVSAVIMQGIASKLSAWQEATPEN
jgi:hypothetical protein